MTGSVLAIVGLRAAALAIAVAGDAAQAERLYALADLVEVGGVTEEHMKLVAEKLKSREITDEDWDDVMDRIQKDSARLHDEGSSPSV